MSRKTVTFKEFKSKPITRMALLITAKHIIEKSTTKASIYNIWEELDGKFICSFAAHEEVEVGDYITYLTATATDICHCNAKVFAARNLFEEDANRPTKGMTFGHAVEAMKQGKKIARKGWNGKGMFAVYSPGCKDMDAEKFFSPLLKEHFKGGLSNIRPTLMLKTAQDDVAYWVPSCSDILAEDWCIVD